MTIAEAQRAIRAKAKAIEAQERKQASFDYILADLIGRSVARVYGSNNKMPTLAEAYPSLFDSAAEADAIQEHKANLSAIRFKQFADSYNKRFKEDSKENDGRIKN